jgi:hypothetical protein
MPTPARDQRGNHNNNTAPHGIGTYLSWTGITTYCCMPDWLLVGFCVFTRCHEHTYVRLLDHAHIVGPITDGERGVARTLDQRGDLRLLQG